MKIIYISSSQIPSCLANSVHVMKMCQALVKNGHKVILLAKKKLKEKFNKKDEDIYKYYGVNACFEIKKLLWPTNKIGGLFYTLQCNKFLSNMNKKNTLVYGRSAYGICAAASKGFKCIYEAHTPPDNKLHYLMENKIFKSLSFKRLVVITHALKKEYLRIFPFLDENRILVAPDGADIPVGNDIEKKEISNWPERDKTLQVGYVGSLCPGRGMEVISKLAHAMPDIDFHVVGGKEEDLKHWKEKNDKNNIYFHGFVPHGKLGAYYRKLDIVLAPYQKRVSLVGGKGDTSRWMSPLKIFEYMAHKKPIVSSNLSVLKEVFEDKRNALLCDPGDIECWKTSILELRKDKSLRKKLGEKAFKDLKDKYTWEQRARHVLEGIDFHADEK